MRTRSSIALAATGLALLAPTAAAGAGGAPAPSATGGTQYGAPLHLARRTHPTALRPVANEFAVPAKVRAGELPRIWMRIDERGARAVRARIALIPATAGANPLSIELGRVPTGHRQLVLWPAGTAIPPGRWIVRLHVRDGGGRTLLRRARTSGRATLTVTAPPARPISPNGVFPVAGAHTFGGEDARFGAPRKGYSHQGQDVLAAEGTPVVAPFGGTIIATDYQAGAAGYYVALHGSDGRDYFFAHCKKDTTAVKAQQAVTAGAQLCQVGHTGDATGPHLHFEIWVGGWHAKGGEPIDPLPDLKAWDTQTGATGPSGAGGGKRA